MEEHAAPSSWTFLTNHAHVLVCIASDPDARLRDIASAVGITERAAQAIVAELEREGYLQREKVGRRNRYALTTDRPLRHPLESHHTVAELIDLIAAQPGSRRARR